MSGKRTIKDLLNRETEKPVLEEIYVEYSVALDQLRRDPGTLNRIVSAFNWATDGEFPPSQLLRYMLNRRKDKDWPTLGKRAKRFKPA